MIDPTVAVVTTGDQGVHVVPWDDDAKAPVYGHRPSTDCPCHPISVQQQGIRNSRYSVYFHDASYQDQDVVNVL